MDLKGANENPFPFYASYFVETDKSKLLVPDSIVTYHNLYSLSYFCDVNQDSMFGEGKGLLTIKLTDRDTGNARYKLVTHLIESKLPDVIQVSVPGFLYILTPVPFKAVCGPPRCFYVAEMY